MVIERELDITSIKFMLGKIVPGEMAELKLLLILKCPRMSESIDEFLKVSQTVDYNQLVFFLTFIRSFILKRAPLIRDRILTGYKTTGLIKRDKKVMLQISFSYDEIVKEGVTPL